MKTIQIRDGITATLTNRTFKAWEKAMRAEANLYGWLFYSEADWQDVEEAFYEADEAWADFFGL
jgi:hypothetical protein